MRMRCPAHAGQTQSGPPRPADMRRAGRPRRARGEALALLRAGRGNGGRRPPALAAWRQAGDLRCVCVAGGGAQVVVAVVVYALRQHVACLLAACLPACFACCCLSALSLILQRCTALHFHAACGAPRCHADEQLEWWWGLARAGDTMLCLSLTAVCTPAQLQTHHPCERMLTTTTAAERGAGLISSRLSLASSAAPAPAPHRDG